MSAEPVAIGSSGEDAITAVIDAQPEEIATAGVPFEESYEIRSTVDEILSGDSDRIALQFPDELLHDSARVYHSLRRALPDSKELYVLADTTYGSCCVDEVAAQHVDAQLVVHYGHTCLSPTARLPAIYVLTKKAVDSAHAAETLLNASQAEGLDSSAPIVLMYDVAHAHAADDLYEELSRRTNQQVILSRIDKKVNQFRKGKAKAVEHEKAFADTLDTDTPPDGVSDIPLQKPVDDVVLASASKRVQYDLPDGVSIDNCAIFYVGGESIALTNLLLTFSKSSIWSYDPSTSSARLESARTNKLLMRRYAVMQKAKDADVIGILIGTLGVAAYLPLINKLRELVQRHDKKAYTVAVGKLNPAKLANFLEIECFVLVACPENSLIDGKDFLRPIVTPFELELALTSKSWTGDYVLDFETLLKREGFGSAQDDEGVVTEDGDPDVDTEDGPVFSSVTGTYRHPRKYRAHGAAELTSVDDLKAQAGALSIRNEQTAVAQILGSAAGAFLSERTYQGLEPRYGQDAPSVVEHGREGIARGYSSEKK